MRVTYCASNCFSPDHRCISLLTECQRGDQHTWLPPLHWCEIWHATFWGNLNFLYFHTVYHVNFGAYRAFKFHFILFYYQFWRCQINLCFFHALEARGSSIFSSPHTYVAVRHGPVLIHTAARPHIVSFNSKFSGTHYDMWRAQNLSGSMSRATLYMLPICSLASHVLPICPAAGELGVGEGHRSTNPHGGSEAQENLLPGTD